MNLNPWKLNTHNRKLLKHGLSARARVVEIAPTNHYAGPPGSHLRVCEVTIEFEAQGGRVVRARGRIPIYEWQVREWMVGEHTFHVRYDPKDPQKWVYSEQETDEAWRAAVTAQDHAFSPDPVPGQVVSSVQVVNASGADPASVIEKLARVRDQGLINQAQFEAAKRQLEAGGGATDAVAFPVTPNPTDSEGR